MFGRPGSEGGKGSLRRRWRAARTLALAALLLAGLAAVGAIGLRAAGVTYRVEELMDVARPWLYAGQLLGTGILWARWQWIVRWLADHKHVSQWAVEPLIRARHRAIALVLLIQLTVGMGLPLSLLGAGGGL